MATILAIFLLSVGSVVTLLFWVERVVNRQRLKELLGRRYPLLYVVYAANGPGLVLLGLVILFVFGNRT